MSASVVQASKRISPMMTRIIVLRNLNNGFAISKPGIDEVASMLVHIKEFTDSVHSSNNLGPVMITGALRPYAKCDLQAATPERTLFIMASNTFTTQETITNAESTREWFFASAKDKVHVAKHFVTLSTNEKAVIALSISKDNMFAFWG
ncbi:hypothetical protein EVG20_g11555 [Dentipellis fragilis]|uniref:Uncharacterized protein n=1 Tax=Dentipellis fragilis TaxID=205917 RepID=A0A4Y9XK77_9AGAM|nr:hypothetical protein EVG20_g11555 [Dentipellis fragilis]